MTEYLDLEDVLRVHHIAHGCNDLGCIRDLGLIEAAAARPRASAFGQDAYADLWLKAAAFLHSIVASQTFVDGNKRTAWRCAWVFLYLNGIELAAGFDVDAAEKFMLGIDNKSAVPEIAEALKGFA
jgi:death on curing protein